MDKNDIEERRELSTSIMPSGLLDRLRPDEIRDLIAYLLADEATTDDQQVRNTATPADSGKSQITLSVIDGQHWLVDSSGRPFFAHGITHVGNNRAAFDFAAISTACKRLGFNAYGYGCPNELRHDLPFIESWNHLVPISTYRGKKIEFVDVFDPEVQARLEQGVKASCNRALKHSENIIGYCWTDLGAWPLDNPTGTNWVEFIRSLPESTPGHQAWLSFKREWHGADESERDQAFLRRIAKEYFRVVGTANRKYDPNHLIFGDRFAFKHSRFRRAR